MESFIFDNIPENIKEQLKVALVLHRNSSKILIPFELQTKFDIQRFSKKAQLKRPDESPSSDPQTAVNGTVEKIRENFTNDQDRFKHLDPLIVNLFYTLSAPTLYLLLTPNIFHYRELFHNVKSNR